MDYYTTAALNAKGGCISATREWVIVCTIGKTLGMKSTVLYKSFIVSLVFQYWNWLHVWKHSHLLKKQSTTVKCLAIHPISTYTCYLCYFWQQWCRSPVQVQISLQLQHTVEPVGKFNQAGFSMLAVTDSEVQYKRKHENWRCEPLLWHSLPGWWATVMEVNNRMNSAVHPCYLYSLIAPNSAATLESFPFGYV